MEGDRAAVVARRKRQVSFGGEEADGRGRRSSGIEVAQSTSTFTSSAIALESSTVAETAPYPFTRRRRPFHLPQLTTRRHNLPRQPVIQDSPPLPPFLPSPP